MSNKSKIKDKKDILQIITRLKVCPNPQGGLFLFLVILLILEDLEQQETMELKIMLGKEDVFFLEKEWEVYIALFYFLLSKIKHLEVKQIDLLIKKQKNISAFLREINSNKALLLESLEEFLNKNRLVVNNNTQKENLEKMLLPNLGKFLEVTDNEKKNKQKDKKKEVKNRNNNTK